MRHELQISTRVRRLFQYLEDFEKGNIQVPLFQRDFVWDNKQKIELLDSIKKGYPIGSILFWRPNSKEEQNLFELGMQTIGCYKLPEKDTDFFYILDGYQRLSTLFGCLVNPSKTKLHRNEKEWIENYNIVYNLEKDEFILNTKKSILEIYEVPVYKFIDGEEFYEFQVELIKLNLPKEKVNDYLTKYKNFGTKISSYDIPSIDLIGGELEDAVDIFSRLNSTGTQISPDWLISAFSYNKAEKFRLGTEIDNLFNRVSEFNYFSSKADRKSRRKLIMQSITTSFGDVYFNTKINQNTLEKLARRDDFIPKTKKTFEAIKRTVKFLSTELSVLDSKLIPYGNQFVFITDFFYKLDNPTDFQLEELKKWFWQTTYSNYFTRYNLSKQRVAYKHFQDFIDGSNETPYYSDKSDNNFETAEFPPKITMGSVRAKALALFMLDFQKSSDSEPTESYQTFNLFPKNKKMVRETNNISENTVLVRSTKLPLLSNINYRKNDLSELLSSSEDYTMFFINDEMKDAYSDLASEQEILRLRQEFLMEKERNFIKKLGIDRRDIHSI